MRWMMLATFVTAVGVGAAACLVDSRCVADSDCAGAEQCNVTTGDCYVECGADDPLACAGDRPHCLLAESRCVACIEGTDCADGEECVSHECVPGAAPDFVLVDENTGSPTFGQTYTLAGLRGSVVMLFFADLG